MTDVNRYAVVVPLSGTIAARMIDPGSGVVWNADAPGMTAEDVLVYYEGNRYNAVNMRDFKERVQCAAGRLWRRYPTVACAVYPRAYFRVIGTYTFSDDWRAVNELEIDEPAQLQSWLWFAASEPHRVSLDPPTPENDPMGRFRPE